MLEWFKGVEAMEKDRRYPLFTFACPKDEVPSVEGYIKSKYKKYSVKSNTPITDEIEVDFSSLT